MKAACGRSIRALAVVASFALASAVDAKKEPDVIFVPTPDDVVSGMLELAKVGPDDVVYDLGSGDGRIPITAAKKFGARGVGVEIDAGRVATARRNAVEAGVSGRVSFVQGDLFEEDISSASVVTLYLLPELNERLMPKLMKELRPGTRIVSHAFPMGEWKPDETHEVAGTTVYLWRVPERPIQKARK